MTDQIPQKKTQKIGIRWFDIFMLLVVLGVPTLFILPSFFARVNSIEEFHARQYLTYTIEAQEAAVVKRGKLTSILKNLQVRVQNPTTEYEYKMNTSATSSFIYAIPRQKRNLFNIIFDSLKLRGYVAAVFIIPSSQQQERMTVTIMCIAIERGNTPLPAPTLINGVPTCPSQTIERKLN